MSVMREGLNRDGCAAMRRIHRRHFDRWRHWRHFDVNRPNLTLETSFTALDQSLTKESCKYIEVGFCFDRNILSSICLIEETMESKMKEIIVKVELVELVELVESLKM